MKKQKYQIQQKRIAGLFAGKTNIIESDFESIEEAGVYLMEVCFDYFSSNVDVETRDDVLCLIDLSTDTPHPVIFEIGDTRLDDGDDVYEIVEQLNGEKK